MQEQPKSMVLLSGGLDSTTTLAIAKTQGFEIYTLTFRYGQRHAFEDRGRAARDRAAGVAKGRVTRK